MSIIWQEQSLRPGAKPWSKHESNRASRMKEQGKTHAEIGNILGRSASAVSMHLFGKRMTPDRLQEWRDKRNLCPSRRRLPPSERPLDKSIQIINRPTPEMLADRDRREAMPHRDLTGAFFGDPKHGLSALDQRIVE